MARLTLSLLGGFQARLDLDPPLLLPAKAQALLAYLGLRPGQTHPRDKLAALLWGSTDDEHARSSLRHTLFDIRQTVRGVSPDPLVSDGKTVALRSDALDVDVLTLKRLIAEGTPAALEQVAALYEGDLLEGLSVDEPPYEEWLVSERERLRELVLEALARLLGHQSKSEPTEPAIQTAIRLLSLDPLQEAVHRALMRLYARQGRRGAALRQYQICVDVFQRELGAEPETETKQLYREILQHRPIETVRRPSSETSPAQGADSPSQIDSPRRQTPLIGREDELARLRRALRDAGRGHPPVMIVQGDAGIGKSRLVEEISAEVSACGGLVLPGRCYDSERILPFGPWVTAVRAAQVASRSEVLDRLAPAWRAELARLLPELRASEIPAPTDRDSDLRLFDALAQLISALAAMQPIAVIIEDLHWADEMSIRLLLFLARRLEKQAVLLLVTARLEEVQETPVLRRALNELAAESRVAQLTLPALSRQETEVLVEALLQRGTQPFETTTIAGQVWALSDGNPFMIVEATRAIREGAIIETDDRMRLPERIREVIVGQLARLSDFSRELVGVAALIGREFEFSVLQAAAGVSARATARGIEELVRRRVLHGVGERLDFAHDRIREVAGDGVLAPHRKLLHARIARALEKVYAQNLEPHVEALGVHYREGEVWNKAAHYLQRAGFKATARSAVQEARAWFEQALGVLAALRESQSTLEQAFDIHLGLRPVLTLLDELGPMQESLRKAEALAEKINDDLRRGWVYAFMTAANPHVGELDKALVAGARALEIAERVRDLRLRIFATHYVAQVHLLQGELERVVELTIDNLSALPVDWVYENLGLTAPPSVFDRYLLVQSLAGLGRFAEAAEYAAEAIRLAEPTHHAYTISQAHFAACGLYIHKGDWAKARSHCERSLYVVRTGNVVHLLPRAVARSALVLAALGEVSEALSRLREGEQLVERQTASGSVSDGGLNYLALGRTCLLLDRLDDARRLGYRAVEFSASRLELAALALLLLGDIATHPDRFDAECGEANYRKAFALAEPRGIRPLVAHCHLGLGKLYRRTGKREQAQEHLTTAATMYREMGMTYWLEQAEAELQALT